MINKFFTIVFTVEMLFKIYGFGIKGYVRDPFNSFDGTLVIFSLIDLLISTLSSGGSSGIGALSAFRTLRMLRVVKLATKSDHMLILLTVTFFHFYIYFFQAIVKTLKTVAYFCGLLFLYIFISALLGMEFYAYKIKVDNHDDYNCVWKNNPVAWDAGVPP